MAYQTSPGRPAKLPPTQKQRLPALVGAEPEAAGSPTGCWNSAIVQELIAREFGVLYRVQYGAALLTNRGFAYQKARFIADHLDAAARARWRATARRQGALLLFGDAARFAQWGSLGYPGARRGEQLLVGACGRRKGDKVVGLIDSFSGRLVAHGHDGRCTAASYCAFLPQGVQTTAQPGRRTRGG